MSVLSVGLSTSHGLEKPPTSYIYLLENQGVQSDIHCSPEPTSNPRQIHILTASLYSTLALPPGTLGENILLDSLPTTLTSLPTNTLLHFTSSTSVEYTTVRITGYRDPKKRLGEYPKGALEKCKEVKDKKGRVVGRKVGVMGVVVRGGYVQPGMDVAVERPKVEKALCCV